MTDYGAASGSSPDIQDAVDLASSGDRVLIPSGEYNFIIDQDINRINNGRAGVEIPGGITIIGDGVDSTILNIPLDGWDNDGSTGKHQVGFVGNGTNGDPIRLAHFTFNGSVDDSLGKEDTSPLSGVRLYGVTDFRVHHINFNDFCSVGAMASNNPVYSLTGNRGVIDHCNFDNPYKDTFLATTGNIPYWAYGVIVNGNTTTGAWDADWKNFFGQYRHDITFIEDCTFSSCRHAVAGSQWGYDVLRNSTLTEQIPANWSGMQDTHGGSQGFEMYDCNIINVYSDSRTFTDSDYWNRYIGMGANTRGGFGLIYDNVF